jgi:hypothetical protein
MELILTLTPNKDNYKMPNIRQEGTTYITDATGYYSSKHCPGQYKTRKWLQSTRRTFKTPQTRLQIPHPRLDSLYVRAESVLALAHFLLDICEAFTPLLDLRGHLGMALFEFVEGVCGAGCACVACAQGA